MLKNPKQKNFWHEIPDAAQAMMMQDERHLEFKKGDPIYQVGEEPRGVYVLKSGLIGLTAFSQKGSEHLLRLFRPNQFFGHRTLFAQEVYHASSICLENSQVGFYEKALVYEILKKFPQTAELLIKTLAQELGRAELHRIRISDETVISRIAEAIVYLTELKEDHPWTREEIAKFCASTTPTVIRALGSLEDEGLIEQRGRKILIKNREKLLQYEGFKT